MQREMSESGCGGRAPSTQGPRLYCVVWGPLASVSGRCEAAHASPSVFTRVRVWGRRGQGRDAWAAAGAGTVLADLIPKRWSCTALTVPLPRNARGRPRLPGSSWHVRS